LQILSAEIIDVIERVERSAKKVLVLDCDNTLWGGVIGEAGVDGISLGSDGVGQIFTNFQSVIKYLASSGVLLAIASKNDEGDVMTVFDRHPGMRINKDEIVSWKVNWKEKSSNLAEIASDLDLGLDSFVFWDDNPLEREKMRNALPMVLTPEVPSDVHEWPAHLYALSSFSKFTSTTEDSKKIEQYKQRSIFITEKERSANELDFLKSIQMKPRLMRIGPETLSRAEQLSNKTNQFNLRVNRYNLVDLQKISSNSDKYVAFMVSLEDRYGNHGIVGMVIAEINGCTAFLDTFLFSCRILGRHVESWALESLINVLRDKNISLLYAEYKQKDRNSMVANFLSENGMKEMGRDESQVPYAAVHEVDAGILYTKKLDGWIFPKTEVFIDAIE
jgi:FkbH-like protein